MDSGVIDYGQTLMPLYSHDNPHDKTLGAKRQPADKAMMGDNGRQRAKRG
jgi:hypothetical protein